jgi:hypothetical protein
MVLVKGFSLSIRFSFLSFDIIFDLLDVIEDLLTTTIADILVIVIVKLHAPAIPVRDDITGGAGTFGISGDVKSHIRESPDDHAGFLPTLVTTHPDRFQLRILHNADLSTTATLKRIVGSGKQCMLYPVFPMTVILNLVRTAVHIAILFTVIWEVQRNIESQ